MTSSVDGLVSGLSTSAMITSLMQVEAAPQNRLKSKVSTAQTVVASYQSVNSKVSTLRTAADSLGQLNTWRSIKPTVSSTAATATATGGTDTATGAVKFSVKALATAQSATMRVDTSTEQNPLFPLDPTKTRGVRLDVPDTITLTVGKVDPDFDDGRVIGTPVTIDVSLDKSAKGIQAKINAAGLGVKVSLVQVGADQSVLQFNGTKTGADYAFAFTGLENADLDGNDIVTGTPAGDSLIEVGGGDAMPGGYSLIGTTNTFTGLMAGVTLTATKIEDDITLSSSSDVAGMAAKFQALVDAANETLTEVGGQTFYNTETKKASPLTGDFSVRQMSQAILSAISQGLSFRDPSAPAATPAETDAERNLVTIKFGSLSKMGVALDATGKLTFKADVFTAAYNADPGAIKNAGVAFADKFESLATTQNNNLTSSITGRKHTIDSLNLQINNWDARLFAKREAMQKKYTGLETALSKLQSQSTWLNGQIGGLG